MVPFLLIPLLLVLGLAAPPSGIRQEKERTRDRNQTLLSLLQTADPTLRRRKVRELLKRHPGDSRAWERWVRHLPTPPLPFPQARKGSIIRREEALSTGDGEETQRREILVYLPESFTPRKRFPLLLAMHGSGGKAMNQISQWRGLADRFTLILIASTGKDTAAGYGFSEAERQSELSTLRFAMLHLPIDRNRVYLGGTSRGGHLSWDLALRFPDRWAGVAPMIGGPRLTTRAGQNNLRLLDNLWGMPILDLQGLKDDPGLIWNLRYAFTYFRKRKAPRKVFFTFPNPDDS